MPITSTTTEPGIVAVTVDYPPVNAIPSRGWFELADAITAAGANPDNHVVILRAEAVASTPAWTSRRCSEPRAIPP